jgi:NitT/TauT family transport system permease protein
MLLPLVSSSQVIPKTAIIPLFLAWHLGYSTTSKSIITFLISFYPVLLGTCLGFSRISDDFIFLFKSFGASRLQTLFRLKLPASVPHIVTGIKAAALYSVIGAITSEIFMGGQGIGYVINFSSEKLNMEMTFVGLTIATIIGSLFFAGISIFESTFVKKRWGGS